MDVADEAFLETESNIAYQIQHSKYQRSFRSVKPEGYCHYCEDEVEGEKLFCNGKCAALFERHRR